MDTSTDNAYEPEIFKLPFPNDFEDEPYESLAARASAIIGAGEAIYAHAQASGQDIAVTEDDRITSRAVFDGTAPVTNVQTTAEAIHLSALLNAYDFSIVQNASQLRNFCTNILIKIAGDDSNKKSDILKAVDMIGKIKDVALFEERSTVLVQNMTNDQIENKLASFVATLRSRVAQAETVDAVEVRHGPQAS